MIFKGLRLLNPRFANNYTQAMYEAWKVNPKDVHEDWSAVFNKQDKAPALAGNPEHI
jgi:2-oxoglutarate dehydrogenase complex dehydrogenase (E1) component-like enzyme